MPASPDIAGYAAAQERLRAKAGREIPFYTPVAPVWPDDVPKNAQGEPLDPSVEPVSGGGFSSVPVNCNVATRSPISHEAPVTDGPLGFVEHRSLMLIADLGDQEAVEGATQCEVFGARYEVKTVEPDQVGGDDPQRLLIFVEKM